MESINEFLGLSKRKNNKPEVNLFTEVKIIGMTPNDNFMDIVNELKKYDISVEYDKKAETIETYGMKYEYLNDFMKKIKNKYNIKSK